MKNFLLFTVVFLSIFASSFAADKIYTIGHTTGIVADDTEWDCSISQAFHPMTPGQRDHCTAYIK